MFTFNPRKYIIRVAKYLIYITLLLTLFVFIASITSEAEFKYDSLFRPDTKFQMIAFIVGLSLIYPLVGYIKKRVYTNGTFEQDRDKIIEVLTNSNFVLVEESDSALVFIHRQLFIRVLRLFEDKIVVYKSDTPIVIEGQRKDVYRLARSIEYAVSNKE